jgi:septum site-determining protein MinD
MLKVDDVLGIIPDSEEVLRASNLGCPVTLHNPASAPARAYAEAARRLMGETIEIIVPIERKGLISRLFGRSVA